MSNQDLFLRIRALTHALDTMISSNGDVASEDVSILCWMLKDAVDEYDKKRTEE